MKKKNVLNPCRPDGWEHLTKTLSEIGNRQTPSVY